MFSKREKIMIIGYILLILAVSVYCATAFGQMDDTGATYIAVAASGTQDTHATSVTGILQVPQIDGYLGGLLTRASESGTYLNARAQGGKSWQRLGAYGYLDYKRDLYGDATEQGLYVQYPLTSEFKIGAGNWARQQLAEALGYEDATESVSFGWRAHGLYEKRNFTTRLELLPTLDFASYEVRAYPGYSVDLGRLSTDVQLLFNASAMFQFSSLARSAGETGVNMNYLFSLSFVYK